MRKRRRRAPTAAKTNGTTSTTQSQPHTHTQPQQQYAPRNTAASVGVTGSTAADGKRTDTRDGGVVHTNAVHVRKPSVPKLTLAQKLSKRRPTNKRTSGFT
ncbi:hypothetical protein SARC_10784 [Sphaeroforma arctica JP610]|uniref:Uncharacterized protein n=1 Tax=Sphaeroforma arctica JP610 TaxID=667725 RepID=A0A0L0FJT4_9EUKA|nr:hypothetical protein SARC_10784 [Sphaeroforma arctica JP610]KNC76731.1 hypothetical protein SARC_10784 [Sphaeroforma arctica JP610]|eukprot:XP_014150633.1 hypothetical protein SARC_10784 [Sphaeroforma arctica JP610]